MTSSTAATSNASRPANARRARTAPRGAGARRAFTLVEMLVVIGIIISLLGVLLPAVGIAWRKAIRTRMGLDLQLISTGLEAYKADFNDYPRVVGAAGATVPEVVNGPAPLQFWGTTPQYGSVVLGRCMMGALNTDSADGPGFRVRPSIKQPDGSIIHQGRVYGPYIPVERFKIDAATQELQDRNKKPILYYPGFVQAKNLYVFNLPYTGPTAYGAALTRPMFNEYDNAHAFPVSSGSQGGLRMLLGDTSKNGSIVAPEAAAYTGPYLLLSAGPDAAFGPTRKPAEVVSASNRCDDVANFERAEY